jgi:hypothetical protein
MFVVQPFVRMEEHGWNSTLSLVQSKESVVVDTKNRPRDDPSEDHVVENSFSPVSNGMNSSNDVKVRVRILWSFSFVLFQKTP